MTVNNVLTGKISKVGEHLEKLQDSATEAAEERGGRKMVTLKNQ